MASAASPALEKKMDRNPGKIGVMVFGVALLAGLIYTIVGPDLHRRQFRPTQRVRDENAKVVDIGDGR